MSIRSELLKLRKKVSSVSEELETIAAMVDESTGRTGSEKEIITIDGMAELLEVSPVTIRRYIKDGLLTPYRIGNQMYFLRRELPQMLAAATKAREEEK